MSTLPGEVSHQAGTVLPHCHMAQGENPRDLLALQTFVQTCLSSDPGLNSLMESAVGYLHAVDYVAITDTNLVALVHSNPDEVNHPLTPSPRYSQLVQAGLLRSVPRRLRPPARL